MEDDSSKEVVRSLLEEFPTFRLGEYYPADENLDLPYVVAGAFAHFLLDRFEAQDVAVLQRAGLWIEGLFGSPGAEELATIGFLEAIQNVWSNQGTDPNSFHPFLQRTSRAWWDQLNKFWNGEIRFVGETIDLP